MDPTLEQIRAFLLPMLVGVNGTLLEEHCAATMWNMMCLAKDPDSDRMLRLTLTYEMVTDD